MSYDITLRDAVSGEVLELDSPHQMHGGTYEQGGTTALWLNVTYNYSAIFGKPQVLGEKGIEKIDGLSGFESLEILSKAIENLGDDTSTDYWMPTEGNAKRALIQLLTMARFRPDGIWKVK